MRWSTVIAAQTDAEWFEEYVRTALNSPAPALPPNAQRIGASTATWFETEPGIAFIHTTGGSIDDRTLAEIVVREQLRGHGIKQAHYDFDHEPQQKTAAWTDIEAKAKRLIQSGQVQLNRNGYNSIVGTVQGDHGTYQTEISRDDPNSRVITQWTCECPWDQYAFQRTRKWKKYEGRPCAHVLATYWKSLSTPLDEDAHPANGGQQSLFDMPQVAPAPGGGGPGGPVAPPQGQQMQIPGVFPGQATGTPQGPPGQPPPAGPDILPQFPMDPSLQPQVNPASVPGLRQPSPTNPVQYPGGTFSSVQDDWHFESDTMVAMPITAAQPAGFINGNMVSTKHDDWGTWVGRSEDHGAGATVKIPASSPGEVLGSDPTTGMVQVLFMNQGLGVQEHGDLMPWGATAWFLPSELVERPDIPRPGPAVKRR
jgi:hypothetical protein